MEDEQKKCVIISISSDIGFDMALDWLDKGWRLYGTYRTWTDRLKTLSDKGVELSKLDLCDLESIGQSTEKIFKWGKWDLLLSGVGAQAPVGNFSSCVFDEWAESVNVNFVEQLRLTHSLLETRNRTNPEGSKVLFFAGGGTNNATVNYSAYTISKIALIKMCELLDAEIEDTSFTIVGPGWVKTKIHEATLIAGDAIAGDNYKKTKQKLAGVDCTPMRNVLDCINWLVCQPKEVISGRNFSVVFDKWGSQDLSDLLRKDSNLYKLRRNGNEALLR
jgi:NAD(P)-dependent dehydrogenase (short-subunit alcohol dehydrogenase family)